jgi:hypothetical protein
MTAAVDTQTTAPATAKKAAPAKATKAAPAKRTPATPAAKAAPATANLRWQYTKETKLTEGQSAVAGDRSYAVKPAADGTWKGTVTVDDGKPEVLSDTTFAKAYAACVQHNRQRQSA